MAKRNQIGTMSATLNLSLKEVPAATHRRLKERAEANHRSLNSEILAILDAALSSRRIDAEENIRKAQVLRQKFHGTVSETDLNKAKRAGRA